MDRCQYQDRDGHLCRKLLCTTHICRYFDIMDPESPSCQQFIKDNHSVYCVNHSSQCHFIIEPDHRCPYECSIDAEGCDLHQCGEPYCLRQYHTTIPKKMCHYHFNDNII